MILPNCQNVQQNYCHALHALKQFNFKNELKNDTYLANRVLCQKETEKQTKHFFESPVVKKKSAY